jgi:hypothetical protein
MNENEGLNLLDFLASGINKNDPVIQSILSDYEGNGATANEIEELVKFINYYTRTDDIRNHRDNSLDLIIKEFTNLNRRVLEKDEIYLRRCLSITERKKDQVWGTKWNIKHIFETYFDGIEIFVAENTSDANLVINGDFEVADEGWDIDGGAEISYSARFSGGRGLYFNRAAGSAAQSVELEEGAYVLHFFLQGNVDVEVKDSAGKYWDMNRLEWLDNPAVNKFESGLWDDQSMFIKVLPEYGDVITVKFIGTEEYVITLDYARLYRKLPYPTYTVIVKNDGYAVADKTLHLGRGIEDPDPAITWYPKESYFDSSYVVGKIGAYRQEVYFSLLDIIQPKGIRAFVETIERVSEE